MKPLKLADWFSIYRIIMAPVLVLIVLAGYREVFTWLFCVSLFTDMIDGRIARRSKTAGSRGAKFDSVGDALTFISGLIAAWLLEREFILDHIEIVLTGLGLYILQVLLATIRYGRPSSYHTYLAKTAALAQGLFMLFMFFFGPWEWLFYLAAIITIIEAIEEIILVFMVKEWRSDLKGIYWVLREKS